MTTLDPGRTGRALSLRVEQLSDGEYVVSGGAREHVVEHDGDGWSCSCPDSHFHAGEVCKHRLSVHLHRRLDGRVLDALRSAVEVLLTQSMKNLRIRKISPANARALLSRDSPSRDATARTIHANTARGAPSLSPYRHGVRQADAMPGRPSSARILARFRHIPLIALTEPELPLAPRAGAEAVWSA